MTLFDLVFIVLFFVAFGTLLAAAIAALRGRGAVAVTRLRRLAMGVAGYFAVVVIVSLVTPRRYLAVGDEQCSDDWCISVTGSRRTDAVSHGLEVTMRIASKARRVAQSEHGVVVYLRDSRGRTWQPVPRATDLPFDARLEPLQELTVTRIFSVPPDAPDLGVVIARAFAFPGCCIIGDNNSILHRKTVVRLS